MKKFLVFTVLLATSFCKSLACGYSPYGEDVRYCLFKPEYFGYSQYKAFYYSANLFGFDYDENPNNAQSNVEANILDWYHFTNKKVSIDAIEDFNYSLLLTDIHSKSNNEFIQYLYKNKQMDAIAYLKIAKNCEAVNTIIEEDAWERSEVVNTNGRKLLLDKLVLITQNEKNLYFKRKYAFLAIRLAYYDGRQDIIEKVFENNFNTNKKDYLYNWSLYFYTFTKSDGESMVNAANLMANCPEKSYASYYYFHNNFKIPEALQQAKTKEEIANVYAYASVQKVDKTLDYLKEIYKNNPKSEILGFLVLREMNKIEDWVYTPYYTNYSPSLEFDWSRDDKITTETLRNRSENDRLYAQEVLGFIQSIDSKTTQNPIIWEAAQINLQFITRKYSGCLQQIALFEKRYKGNKVVAEIQKIKALCITANQENGKAIIKPEIQNTILKFKSDQRFIFALGRELEFKGNIIDGIALLSFVETVFENEFSYDDVEWQGNRIQTSGNLEVFYTYFDYLDFVYSAQDLQTIVDKLKSVHLTPFQKVIYVNLLQNNNNLKDLLGTKYIRENKLDKALIAFKAATNKYWETNYNAWERGDYRDGYSFDQNPFYDFKYTEDFIDHKDKFLVTKLSVTQHLIRYTNLANNPKTKDRDYYYFLLANCYYNMSDYGNSWMMRRYGYSSSSDYYGQEFENESYIDEIEYRNKIKAVAYYKLAFQNAKTPKFKALCLRMMDFAESNTYSTSEKVATQFPKFSSDLSGCENLENYFKARR